VRSLVYGIGVNEKEYPTWDVDKPLREYGLWKDMLFRCTEKYWAKTPNYLGVTCSENFKHYSFFYEWCQTQVGYYDSNEKGRAWALDKDLLVKGNKHYSEDTCVFLPQSINNLLCRRGGARGEYLIGVTLNKKVNRFMSRCNRGEGVLQYLGYFDTQEEAFQAYKVFKEDYIKKVANEYKHQLDPRAYQALLNYTVEITD